MTHDDVRTANAHLWQSRARGFHWKMLTLGFTLLLLALGLLLNAVWSLVAWPWRRLRGDR